MHATIIMEGRLVTDPEVKSGKNGDYCTFRFVVNGKTVICNIKQAHIARQIMAVQKCNLLDMQYIKLFLDSSFDLLKTKGQGVIPGIDRTSVLHLLFPLPPLNEQHRIVQRIEELLPLVKGL